MTVGPTTRSRHHGCLYASDEEFLATTVPFVNAGLEAGEPVLVATTSANLHLLGSVLGDRASRVDHAETGYFGRRPHQRVAAFRDYWRRHPGAGYVRIIAEPVWAGRSARDIEAWQRMESGLNLLLADTNVWMICPYDRRTADPAILVDAARTHPHLVTGEQVTVSDDYLEPAAYASVRDRRPLPDPPDGAATAAVTPDLGAVRQFAASRGGALGLSGSRLPLMVAAVNEAASYLLEQAAGEISLRLWAEFGGVVCDLSSTGHGLDDPLVGYRSPELRRAAGDRLWLVRQLCTHVDTRSTAGGCTIRLYLPGGRDEEPAGGPR